MVNCQCFQKFPDDPPPSDPLEPESDELLLESVEQTDEDESLDEELDVSNQPELLDVSSELLE